MSLTLVPPVAGAYPIVDTSSNNEDDQHQIDWPTLAAFLLAVSPQAGAIIKLSQGDHYVNPYLHRQRWGAHAAGLQNVGLYHYVELVSGKTGKGLSGADNADFFLRVIGEDGGIVKGEFLAGDWEDQSAGPDADLAACARDFGSRIQQPLGIAPLLYSAEWYANPHDLERDPRLTDYLLWWASYQSSMPPVPEPWGSAGKGIALWQFTDRAQLPGLPWACDVSWWLAGLPALRSIQWGFAKNPLDGQPVDPPPDVDVPATSESTTDAGTIARKISEDALALASLLSDADLKRRAMILKADSDLLQKVLWSH